ncbi:MAG: leucine-rich repeat domain-containing protein [Clostridiales bacterium]|nr:leucine-rich repeat domain-containing protein [Clostridiales bacterium]
MGDWDFSTLDNLESIYIPKTVTSIDDCVFYFCVSLNSIEVSPDNEYYSASNGVLFNKDQSKIICYPKGSEQTSYTIPSGVISIENYAFLYSQNLTDVIIPDSVTKIGIYAFFDCSSLTNLTIGGGVTKIDDSAFIAAIN